MFHTEGERREGGKQGKEKDLKKLFMGLQKMASLRYMRHEEDQQAGDSGKS